MPVARFADRVADVEVWDRTMAVNARGVMLGCKLVVQSMRAAGGGAIANTSSLSGQGQPPE